MTYVEAHKTNPAKPGRYHVMAWLDYHGRIVKATVVWQYGFWHIAKRNRVVEWLDETK